MPLRRSRPRDWERSRTECCFRGHRVSRCATAGVRADTLAHREGRR
ncbi:Uncharacterised protein [Amycolatopsis camponoti]|uniref:Uncharacterized protein n=1 Tax=Amycolatopsis camponoti TaxID=2606593 RepID=A0A6I8M505_9PSEU|nr:Uncharacterised protein [Amycolatopsis camponoti]